jgi:hypothetical protein
MRLKAQGVPVQLIMGLIIVITLIAVMLMYVMPKLKVV